MGEVHAAKFEAISDEDGQTHWRITCPECGETVGDGDECPCGLAWSVLCVGQRQAQ